MRSDRTAKEFGELKLVSGDPVIEILELLKSIYLLIYGHQADIRLGLMYVLYKIFNESILMCLKVRVAWRKADIPLLAAATH